MPDDMFFDTAHENRNIDVEANLVAKGDDINISELDPTMQRILIGVGWDLRAFDADAIDLDVCCFLLDKDGQTLEDEDFIFYNNLKARAGAVVHNGDSRTGAGDGDDESLTLDLTKIPFDIVRILFVVAIYQGFEKEQNIGMLKNSYIRLVNADTTEELLRYVLQEELEGSRDTAMIVAALDREGPKWHFRPLADFPEGGLEGLATNTGIIVAQAF